MSKDTVNTYAKGVKTVIFTECGVLYLCDKINV
jgi:hypothetical protein